MGDGICAVPSARDAISRSISPRMRRPAHRPGVRRRATAAGHAWQISLDKCPGGQRQSLAFISDPGGDPMNVTILLYDDFTALDAIGPYEVLRFLPGARVQFVAKTAGI